MATLTRRDKALRKMAALPKSVRAAAKAEIFKNAQELTNLIRRRAPIDEGDLRDSVSLFVGGAPGTNAAKADPELTVDIVAGRGKGSTTEHARPVEFGTADTPAQPFFYPSYRQMKSKIKRNISRAVMKAARAVAAT